MADISAEAEKFYVKLGDFAEFSKTISESDIYLYAGLTGDFSPNNHINEAEMRKTAYGKRMAHGAMLIGFMSMTSTMVAERSARDSISETPVSLGYDRIRFIAPVFIGHTITVRYEVASIDLGKRRAVSDVTITNDDGKVFAAGQHILKWVPREAEASRGHQFGARPNDDGREYRKMSPMLDGIRIVAFHHFLMGRWVCSSWPTSAPSGGG